MGPDGGTWVPYRLGLRLDPRIAAAVTAMAEGLERFLADEDKTLARVLAGRAIEGGHLDLTLWALGNGYDDGRVDMLSDAMLAMHAVPWLLDLDLAAPGEIGFLLRQSMLAGGVLEQDGTAQRIADFADDNRKLLGDRARKRRERKAVRGPSSERPSLQEQEQEQEQEPEQEEVSKRNLPEDIAGAMSTSDNLGDDLFDALLKTTGRSGNEDLIEQVLESIRESEVEDATVLDRLRRLGPTVCGEPPWRLRDLLLRPEEHRSGLFNLPRKTRSTDRETDE